MPMGCFWNGSGRLDPGQNDLRFGRTNAEVVMPAPRTEMAGPVDARHRLEAKRRVLGSRPDIAGPGRS